jgi:hypothetical protein
MSDSCSSGLWPAFLLCGFLLVAAALLIAFLPIASCPWCAMEDGLIFANGECPCGGRRISVLKRWQWKWTIRHDRSLPKFPTSSRTPLPTWRPYRLGRGGLKRVGGG